MKLYFDNWNIRLTEGPVARQYDHGTQTLELTGNLPQGWQWQILLSAGDQLNILALTPSQSGAAVTLEGRDLALQGPYRLQLRGTRGNQIRHSNTELFFVPGSLSGDEHWPEIPTEFSQLEARITSAAQHPPVPGNTGTWLLWDPEAGVYRDGGQALPRAADGLTPHIGDTGNWYLGQTDTGVPARAPGWEFLGDALTQAESDSLTLALPEGYREFYLQLHSPAPARSAGCTVDLMVWVSGEAAAREVRGVRISRNPGTKGENILLHLLALPLVSGQTLHYEISAATTEEDGSLELGKGTLSGCGMARTADGSPIEKWSAVHYSRQGMPAGSGYELWGRK